jgi:hypothetical protein
VKINLLGVDLAEDDVSVIGSLGLYVLTLWFFYCMRRENHLIANLFIDALENGDQEINLSAYHGIASYTVFTTIGSDDPIQIIHPRPPREMALARVHPTNIALALFFLPPFTISFTIITDVISLFRVSPFRFSTDPLIFNMNKWEWTEVVVIETVAALIFILTLIKCREILKFERATEGVLRQFHDCLFPLSELPRNDVKQT